MVQHSSGNKTSTHHDKLSSSWYKLSLFESMYMYQAAGGCLPALQENGCQTEKCVTQLQAHAALQKWYIVAAKIKWSCPNTSGSRSDCRAGL